MTECMRKILCDTTIYPVEDDSKLAIAGFSAHKFKGN